MSEKTSSPELLMPAGSLEKLKFAFAYGADAVYAGVPIFSLRARENDFSKESIREAVRYTKALGRRIYLTMNIYAHNSKIDRFLDAFCEMSELEPDGFIMTDAGLIRKALRLRPETVIHLSTQANATNWATVEFWKDLGVRRIILSRELSLAEIGEIRSRVPDIELEAFVHGSICIAYSGRCLISNYLNHRDANQGTCTNSCRWDYALVIEKGSLVQVEAEQQTKENDYQPLTARYYLREAKRAEEDFINSKLEVDEDEYGTYVMNSKDLCAIELLKELRDAGVSSFKVEGRSKTVYYAAVIARAYRNAIADLSAGRPFDPANLREAASTSNRTLMTGFLLKQPREYGENFSDGASLAMNYSFCGQVKSYDRLSRRALVDWKGKVSIGETIEWLTPGGVLCSRAGGFEREDGTKVESAHGGLTLSVKAPCELPDFTLIRKAIEQPQPPLAFCLPAD